MLEVDVGLRVGAFALEAAFSSGAGITALFGRSGAGKTTLLNVIAGLARPERGRVAVGGRMLFDSARGIDVPPHARRVGYVFQEGRLLPHLTVRHNLVYGRFFSRRKTSLGFENTIRLLGIGHLLERRPEALSGGEKQRVAIGRALLANPEILLFDEPLASLDAPRKAEILYYVERLRDEVGIPIVYVSHSLEEVVRLADTVVLMSEGRVLATGPVRDMASRIELRPYLGRQEGGAVIEARVAAQDLENGLARLEFAGGALEIPDVEALPGELVRVRVRARRVARAVAAVRPEHPQRARRYGGEPGPRRRTEHGRAARPARYAAHCPDHPQVGAGARPAGRPGDLCADQVPVDRPSQRRVRMTSASVLFQPGGE